MSTARHRLGQGLRAMLAPTIPVDLELARPYLSAAELAAFQTLSRADQLHSLRVLRQVLEQRPDTPRNLAKAALLHDIGKSTYHLALWQKTLVVLANAIFPPLARALETDDSHTPWRIPFSMRKRHPLWGADILRDCGSDETVIWLVRHHQDELDGLPDHAELENLRRLQAADDA